MATLVYALTVRNSTTGGTRVAGLTPTFVSFVGLSTGSPVSQPSITEIGFGQYKFSYDPVATGEVIWQVDAGASLSLASDRYIDGECTLGDPVSNTDILNILTGTVMPESYATLGATGTLAQLIYELRAFLAESSVVGTTLTTKRLDKTTTAKTYTIDNASTPTSITTAS